MSQQAISNELSLFLSKCKEILLKDYTTTFMSDLYLQFIPQESLLRMLDEEDREISSWIIDTLNQEESQENNLEFTVEQVAKVLRELLQPWVEDEELRSLPLIYPFSIVMVDAQMDTLKELLLIDQDQVILDSELLKNLDQDLNDFLKDLLKDA